jgi:excisionase family DNA binding protein
MFGYNQQYLRRLLRDGRLEGIKVGQVWLIKLASLEAHLRSRQMEQDRRRGLQGAL